MITKHLTRKPLAVEAVLLTRDNLVEVARWCGGVERHNDIPGEGPPYRWLDMSTTRGVVAIQIGTWVVKSQFGVTGCSPEMLRDCYNEEEESF